MVKQLIQLRAVLPSKREVQVELPHRATTTEVKRAICQAAGGDKLRPGDIRVMVNAQEMHASGTLEYYRIFGPTKVHVHSKYPPGVAHVAGRSDTGNGKPKPKPAPKAQAHAQPSAASRPGSAKADTSRYGDPTRPLSAPGASGSAVVTGASAVDPAAALIGPPAGVATSRYYPPLGTGLSDAAITGRPDPAPCAEEDESEVILGRVERGVARLQQELADLRPRGEGPAGAQDWQRHAAVLEERLQATAAAHGKALDRIDELERTVARYQRLLQQALAGPQPPRAL